MGMVDAGERLAKTSAMKSVYSQEDGLLHRGLGLRGSMPPPRIRRRAGSLRLSSREEQRGFFQPPPRL